MTTQRILVRLDQSSTPLGELSFSERYSTAMRGRPVSSRQFPLDRGYGFQAAQRLLGALCGGREQFPEKLQVRLVEGRKSAGSPLSGDDPVRGSMNLVMWKLEEVIPSSWFWSLPASWLAYPWCSGRGRSSTVCQSIGPVFPLLTGFRVRKM
jgi:hypothetical protein